jgi:hypothetical protein
MVRILREADEVKRLRQLETENAWLKKMLVERDLEIDVMNDVAAKKLAAPARVERRSCMRSISAYPSVGREC